MDDNAGKTRHECRADYRLRRKRPSMAVRSSIAGFLRFGTVKWRQVPLLNAAEYAMTAAPAAVCRWLYSHFGRCRL